MRQTTSSQLARMVDRRRSNRGFASEQIMAIRSGRAGAPTPARPVSASGNVRNVGTAVRNAGTNVASAHPVAGAARFIGTVSRAKGEYIAKRMRRRG